MRPLQISQQITNRESLSLDKYFHEIGELKMVTPDEEVDLVVRIRKGDHQALQKLVGANLRFVVSVAKQFQNQGLSLGDLISEGNLGLIRAAQRFDEKRGFKLISYAVWWIRQSIMEAIAKQSRIVRLPLNRVSSITRMNRTSSELQQKYEREPSQEELAEVLDVSTEEVIHNMSISNRHMSLNAPVIHDEEGSNLLSMLESDTVDTPDSKLIKDSLRTDLLMALSSLRKNQATIITLFFGLNGKPPMRLAEIGAKFKLTRERVRQIKERGIRNLRSNPQSGSLKAYLG